ETRLSDKRAKNTTVSHLLFLMEISLSGVEPFNRRTSPFLSPKTDGRYATVRLFLDRPPFNAGIVKKMLLDCAVLMTVRGTASTNRAFAAHCLKWHFP